MKYAPFLALALSLAPVAAAAMPAVSDHVGTNPADATAALQKAGCMVSEFEAEDGKIEAKCADASGARWEIYIDPKSGNVTKVSAED